VRGTRCRPPGGRHTLTIHPRRDIHSLLTATYTHLSLSHSYSPLDPHPNPRVHNLMFHRSLSLSELATVHPKKRLGVKSRTALAPSSRPGVATRGCPSRRGRLGGASPRWRRRPRLPRSPGARRARPWPSAAAASAPAPASGLRCYRVHNTRSIHVEIFIKSPTSAAAASAPASALRR